jgi:hypothetical protein
MSLQIVLIARQFAAWQAPTDPAFRSDSLDQVRGVLDGGLQGRNERNLHQVLEGFLGHCLAALHIVDISTLLQSRLHDWLRGSTTEERDCYKRTLLETDSALGMCLDGTYLEIRVALDVAPPGPAVVAVAAIVEYRRLAGRELDWDFHPAPLGEEVLEVVATILAVLVIPRSDSATIIPDARQIVECILVYAGHRIIIQKIIFSVA